MQCSQCGHHNEDSKFCVKCGQLLAPATEMNHAEAQTAAGSQPVYTPPASNATPLTQNEHVQKVMKGGQQYFGFFLNILKRPAAASNQTTGSDFVNGLISIILYAIMIPLIAYMALLALPSFFRPSFATVFFKPALYILIVLAFLNLSIFLSLKLIKAEANVKEVVARFGAYLTVPLALLAVALVAAVIRLGSISTLFMFLGVIGLVAAICLSIVSFKKEDGQGLDAFYGILISFVVMVILLRLLSEQLVSMIWGSIGGSLF